MGLRRFGISLDEALLDRFDNEIVKDKYPTRSKAIADLINDYLLKKTKVYDGVVAGAISLVYNHHKRMISEMLTDIQHNFLHLIISTQHIHLDHDNCFEIVVVRGKFSEIEMLYNKLKAVKGVTNSYLTIAGPAERRVRH